jgi:hypothetical protein
MRDGDSFYFLLKNMNTYTLRRSLSRRFLATAAVVAVYASIEAPLRHFTSVNLASMPAQQLRDSAAGYVASTVGAELLQGWQTALTLLLVSALLVIWAPMAVAAVSPGDRTQPDAA